MGYDIPAALGAAVATDQLTLCIAGDGSAMMNLQDLETIAYRKLPVKLFLLDNDGYCSIRQTQTNLFSPDLMGCGPASGVGLPDFVRVADAFGFPTSVIDRHDGMKDKIDAILNTPGPAFCVVRIPPEITFSPKLSARRLPDGKMISPTLEDMFPFLDRTELDSNRMTQ